LFVRGAVVITVVDAIADVVLGDAASVVAWELSVGVARTEQAAYLITVIPTVVVVVTAVVVGDTATIPTSEHSGLAGVEGCQSNQMQRYQSSSQWTVRTSKDGRVYNIEAGFT
jgi:putative exporter of polyketide antibiotics